MACIDISLISCIIKLLNCLEVIGWDFVVIADQR